MAKKLILAATLLTALSAVAVSASQLLKKPASLVACGYACTLGGTPCARPCGCYVHVEGATNGICQPEGPPPAPTN